MDDALRHKPNFFETLTPPVPAEEDGKLNLQQNIVEAPQELLVDEADQAQAPINLDIENPPEVSENKNWWSRNWRKLAAAGCAGGIALDLALGNANASFTDLEHRILEVAPWAGVGLASSEALWIGGAALVLAGAGSRIGNPFTLHRRWREITESMRNSRLYNAGVLINGIGALGTAGVVAAATVKGLPVESWPGAGVLIAADVAQTLTSRGLLLKRPHAKEICATSPEVSHSPTVRVATIQDIPELVELDRRLFKGAYHDQIPSREEATEMFTARLLNNPNGMFVAVVNNEIKGFITAFRTNTSVEDFKSWEACTANGTLEGKVDENGRYIYVANLTVDTTAKGAEHALDMLMAYAFAKGISDGVEYGYFCSRLPGFRRWAEARAKDMGIERQPGQQLEEALDKQALNGLAAQYITKTKNVDTNGKKQRPLDPEIAMYAQMGLAPIRLVSDGFQDWKSMNYEVVFKAPVPAFAAWSRHIKFARESIGFGLRWLARHPKLLKRVL